MTATTSSIPAPRRPSSRPAPAAAPVRALFYTGHLGGGGAEMHLLRLLNALDRREVEPTLAVSRGGGSYQNRLAADVPVYQLTRAEGGSTTLALAASVTGLRALVARLRPDVLCAVMDRANVAALLATAGMKHPPRLVLCVQNTPSIAYSNERSPYDQAVLHAIRRYYQRADRVVAISHGVASDLVTQNRALKPIIEVIYNIAVDDHVEACSRAPAPRPADGSRVVVAVGKLHPQKGFTVLLDAVARARARVPLRLWLLGEGRDRALLERRARALGIRDAVDFLGFQDDPFRYMAGADVFALSSIYEGFGNVIVEAMACGTPVVSTYCPHGPAEVITHGVDGVLVPPGDADALAEALVRTVTDQAFSARLVENAARRARDFQSAVVADAYARTLRDVASRARGPRGQT